MTASSGAGRIIAAINMTSNIKPPRSRSQSTKPSIIVELQQLRKHTRQFMHNINAEQNKQRKVEPVSPPPFHYFGTASSNKQALQPRKAILKSTQPSSNEATLEAHKVRKANFAHIPPPPPPLVQTLTSSSTSRPGTAATVNRTRRNTMSEYFDDTFTRQHSLSPDKFSPRIAAATSEWQEPIDVLSETSRKLSLKVGELKKKNTKFIFQKNEDYFDELQKYRLENPHLFYKYAPSRSKKDVLASDDLPHNDSYDLTSDKQGVDTIDSNDYRPTPLGSKMPSHEEPKITDGYFTLNERYYPYSVAQQADIVSSGVENSYRQLFQLEDLGAVKISIPKAYVQPVQRNLKPASRRDYDPRDSMSLSRHLAAGYAPIASAQPAKGIFSYFIFIAGNKF